MNRAVNMDINLTVINIESNYEKCVINYPFRFFYSLVNNKFRPEDLSFSLNNDVPDYILNLSSNFSKAFKIFTEKCLFKSPLTEGVFYLNGARFIDVFIDDIPIQRGLVSSELIDQSSFFQSPSMHGRSIKIRLHRDLIRDTATPIHELFHVFQYNYCHFNNMWFMEGLARWSQNLTHKRREKIEILPQDRDQLQKLFRQAHESEYFWRRLLSFFDSPVSIIKSLLESCELFNSIYNKSDDVTRISWTREQKRDRTNNILIMRALLKAIQNDKVPDSPEVLGFIKVIEDYASLSTTVAEDITIKTADDLIKYKDIEEVKGDLTVSVDDLSILSTFNNLEVVSGTIKITNNLNLEEVSGFNNLYSVGNIEISRNPQLTKLEGFSSLFHKIRDFPGYLKIVNNSRLQSIKFLYGLKTVRSSLYLHHNKLNDLSFLSGLVEVGASFSLSSNRLSSLKPLSNLNIVKGMLGVAFNQLTSLDGLENLSSIGVVKWNNEYRSLALQGNKKLVGLEAICNMRSDTGALIINLDSSKRYKFPASQSAPFYNQRIKVYSGEAWLDVNSLTPHVSSGKLRLLFDKTWQKTLSQYDWMESYFISFDDAIKVAKFAHRHDIDFVFGQTSKSQRFINKNESNLYENGLKFLKTSPGFIDLCIDKDRFYKYMESAGFGEFVPKVYNSINEAVFPAVVKSPLGSNGKNIQVVNSKADYDSCDIDGILCEYILGDVEYASNMIFYKGEVLFDKTFVRHFNTDSFILKSASVSDTVLSTSDSDNFFKDIFSKIIKSITDDVVFCCFDYKVKNGVPKIFEINTRLGFTLAKDSEGLKEAVSVYCELVQKYA